MLNRRQFVKFITYAGGTLCIAQNGFAAFMFKDAKTKAQLQKTLEKTIKGDVVTSRLILKEFSTDFGKAIHKEPTFIVVPKDEADVISTLQIANDMQIPVSLRGAGHSCFGQTLSSGGIVLARSASKPDIQVNNKLVSVSGHCLWIDLEKQLNRRNLTSPVLTDYLGLSVGGTLSVGGFGLRSFEYGSQVDNITEFELILPTGKKVTCSKKQNPDLFSYSLCGLGQLGQVHSATFNVIDYKKYTVVYYLFSKTIDEFFDACRIFLNDPIQYKIDHFSGYRAGEGVVLEIGTSFKTREKQDYSQLQKFMNSNFKYYRKNEISDYHLYIHQTREKWVNKHGASYHLWEDYVFDIDGLKEFLYQTVLSDKYKKTTISPALYFLASKGANSGDFPLAPMPSISSDLQFGLGVGFYYMVDIGNKEDRDIVIDQLQENRDKCISLGGRPYLYGCHYLGEKEKTTLYGKDYEKLKMLKRKYDPLTIVNPGVFV